MNEPIHGRCSRDENRELAAIHPDLLAAKKLAYEPIGWSCKNVVKEAESEEYGASSFEMNQKQIKFRIGKITPTKVGQFVTLWKRIESGVTAPHDLADPFDLFIVSVRRGEQFGQFLFPKRVLFEKGIVSRDGVGGKRGIRIYPPWDKADNKQAKSTQGWQLLYFIEIPTDKPIDVTRMKQLLIS